MFFSRRLLVFGLFAAFAAAMPTPLSAEVYVVRGKNGVVTFTSRKPEGKFERLSLKRPAYSVFVRRGKGGGAWRVKPVTSKYDELISQFAKENSVEPSLVKAVVHAESGFNPKARSNKGAMGLMQLMPGTAQRFGVQNAWHVEKNLDGGSKYLRFLLKRYGGNERLAVAAYNAGEGAVDPIMDVPPYSETQVYVRRVLKLKEMYRCVESGKRGCPKAVYVE
ncbi:MAG: lytic transglycosylase domain-containing protein [Deltaproteobacteria bacterium]|nr:lytic transglycosylase domain-containing protein [Deltaproteobacteria bacterium]